MTWKSLAILVILQGMLLTAADQAFTAEKLAVQGELLYSPIGPVRRADYRPAERVWFALTLKNLAVADDNHYVYSLRFELKARDGSKLEVIGPQTDRYKPHISSDVYVQGTCQLPSSLSTDTCTIVAYITDEVSQSTASIELPLRVTKQQGPHPLSPSFNADPQGSHPLSGRFTTGERVYLHFEIGGLDTLADDEECECTLTFVADNKTLGEPLHFAFRKSEATPGRPLPGRFQFSLQHAFKGHAQVSVKGKTLKEPIDILLPVDVSAPLRCAESDEK